MPEMPTNKEIIDELKGVIAILRADEKLVKLRMDLNTVCNDLGVSPISLGEELEFLQQTASKIKYHNDIIKFIRNPGRGKY
tara:strand:- start:261 stop:503 length:243 start_codon:yes stop_codon:yes gene_type:complete